MSSFLIQFDTFKFQSVEESLLLFTFACSAYDVDTTCFFRPCILNWPATIVTAHLSAKCRIDRPFNGNTTVSTVDEQKVSSVRRIHLREWPPRHADRSHVWPHKGSGFAVLFPSDLNFRLISV